MEVRCARVWAGGWVGGQTGGRAGGWAGGGGGGWGGLVCHSQAPDALKRHATRFENAHTAAAGKLSAQQAASEKRLDAVRLQLHEAQAKLAGAEQHCIQSGHAHDNIM
jgi:hypothetical protein